MEQGKLTIDLEELRKNKSEGSLYYAWQANIAMAFKDEYNRSINKGESVHQNDLHEIANQAAKNFLDILIKE